MIHHVLEWQLMPFLFFASLGGLEGFGKVLKIDTQGAFLRALLLSFYLKGYKRFQRE